MMYFKKGNPKGSLFFVGLRKANQRPSIMGIGVKRISLAGSNSLEYFITEDKNTPLPDLQ
jgi:hypothetical protein